MNDPLSDSSSAPWYRGISRYEWLVLIIASAGWIFDVYEGQIFNLTRNDMLGDILGADPGSDVVKQYGDWFPGAFQAVRPRPPSYLHPAARRGRPAMHFTQLRPLFPLPGRLISGPMVGCPVTDCLSLCSRR